MKDTAYFCPFCGSPSVERSVLAGGAASCRSCSWKGKNEDLHSVPFEHDFSSPDQVIARFAAEFSGVIAQHLAVPIGSLLMKWGFISSEELAVDLGVYMKAMAAAAAKAVFETREGLSAGTITRPKKTDNRRKGVH